MTSVHSIPVWLHRLRHADDGFGARHSTAGSDEQRYLAFYGLEGLLDKGHWSAGHMGIDGFRIFVQRYRPAKPRGTVLVLHGYYDHSGLYGPLVDALLDLQLDVWIYDQPGHGLSSGDQAEIDDFDTYGSVFDQMRDIALKGKKRPHYCAGQSMGGAVIMDAITCHPDDWPVDDVILFAPLVRITNWFKVWGMLNTLGRWRSRLPRRFSRNSHDQDFLVFMRSRDPLQCHQVSAGWVAAMMRWSHRFVARTSCQVPMLVIQGDDDRTVDARFNLPAIRRLFPGVEEIWLKDGRHHLVREGAAWREQWCQALRKRWG
jgi:alpha-beta hydrolase superfamily lysophospholipase